MTIEKIIFGRKIQKRDGYLAKIVIIKIKHEKAVHGLLSKDNYINVCF